MYNHCIYYLYDRTHQTIEINAKYCIQNNMCTYSLLSVHEPRLVWDCRWCNTVGAV